jgi:hypothetical protein
MFKLLTLVSLVGFISHTSAQESKRPTLKSVDLNVVTLNKAAIGPEATGVFKQGETEIALTVGAVKAGQAHSDHSGLILGVAVGREWDIKEGQAFILQGSAHKDPDELHIVFIRPTWVKEDCRQELSVGIGVEYFKDQDSGIAGMGIAVGGEIERNITDILRVGAAYNGLKFMNGDPVSNSNGHIWYGNGDARVHIFEGEASLRIRSNASLTAGVEHKRISADMLQPVDGYSNSINKKHTKMNVGVSIKHK